MLNNCVSYVPGMDLETIELWNILQNDFNYLACFEQYDHVAWSHAKTGKSFFLVQTGDDNETNPYNPTAAPLFFIGDINIFFFAQPVPTNHDGSATMPLDILRPRHPHIQSDWNSYMYKLHRLMLIACSCYGQRRIICNVMENDNVLKLQYCMKTSVCHSLLM
jgi:hypothetical protein